MEKTGQSSIKRHKVSDAKQSMASTDRLSCLPDLVICHILSFLPTKISVSTSILAKRWRLLWAHVPALDFESTELSILDIICRVMLLYKVESMDSFRLSYAGHHDDLTNFRLETCVTAGILHNVKKLHLFLASHAIVPHCIFTCKTLVDLRLDLSGDIHVAGKVYLPVLKRLHLNSVNKESVKSFTHLLPRCLVLEDLIIHFSDIVCCCIHSPTLKKLTLGNHGTVYVATPALRYLQVQGCVTVDASARTVASLSEAEIIIGKLTLTGVAIRRYFTLAIRFVCGLHNVKRLKLLIFCSIVRARVYSALNKKFPNLTKLELAADWRALSYFLENSDNLEALIIDTYHGECGMKPHQESKCLSSHLRTVTIGRFGCTEHEFELVGYLLLNAKVLKRMEIYSEHVDGTDFKAKFEALKRISLFPRGSVACELAFH